MCKIKGITRDTDLSSVSMHVVGWDLVLNGRPYDVVRIEGFVHSIGGRWGSNDYWAYPYGEKPCFDNLVEFSGRAPTWGIRVEERNRLKSKWGEDEVRDVAKGVILRNGEPFYEFFMNDFDYSLAKARKELVEIQEHVIAFSQRDWKQEVLGRKVYFRNEPGIIESVSIPNFEVFVVPDGIKRFSRPAYCDYDWSEYEEGLCLSFLDKDIWWFRN